MCLDNHDNFGNVIWTDESSVQLKRHCQIVRVKIGRERTFKPAAKHALKVHVWGGISKRRATHICIFDQTMDATLYIKILEDFLLPFIESYFQGTDYRFMQGSNPKPTSLKARAFYEEKGINWWPTFLDLLLWGCRRQPLYCFQIGVFIWLYVTDIYIDIVQVAESNHPECK